MHAVVDHKPNADAEQHHNEWVYLTHGNGPNPEDDCCGQQVRNNAQAMAKAFIERNYKLISGGTDNHMMLIDLRNKNISGKDCELALVKADITANKNMVPFDDKSPFVTSGIRVGTPAITTRGLVESDMETIVELIDRVLMNHTDEAVIEQVAEEVNEMMGERAMFVF